jgi:hypothetical protein
MVEYRGWGEKGLKQKRKNINNKTSYFGGFHRLSLMLGVSAESAKKNIGYSLHLGYDTALTAYRTYSS